MSTDGHVTTLPVAVVSALCAEAAPVRGIFLPTTDGQQGVLFRSAGNGLPRPDFERLQNNGVTHLQIECEGLDQYESELEQGISTLLSDPRMDPVQKAACVRHFGLKIAHDMSTGTDIAGQVQRAHTLLDAVIENVLNNQAACSSLLSMCGHHRSTASHMFAVSTLAILLGQEVFGTDPERLRALGLAGMVHDLGKKSVPEDTLRKNTPLSDDEMDLLRHHPIESVRLLGEDATVPSQVRQMVLQHHERFDGKGYPLGLSGGELLPESRILSIVDSFHAMIGRRDYRRPMGPMQAVHLMRYQAGRQFDPDLFAAWDRFVQYKWRALDKRKIDGGSEESVGKSFHADHQKMQPRRHDRAAIRQACAGTLVFPCAYAGRLAHLTAAPDQLSARVTDLSRTGMGFLSPYPLFRGEVLNVRASADSAERWISSVVCWCRRDSQPGMFRVGLRYLQRIAATDAHRKVDVMPYYCRG